MTISSAELLPVGTGRAASQSLPSLLRPWLLRRAAVLHSGPRRRFAALFQARMEQSPGPTGERPIPHVLPGHRAAHENWLVYTQARCLFRTPRGAVQRNPLDPRTARDRSLVTH